MEKLLTEYDRIACEMEQIHSELDELHNNESVKRYLELRKMSKRLLQEQIECVKKISHNNYYECNHILVYSRIHYDSDKGRNYKSCGCIKCGLDSSVMSFGKEQLTLGEQIMYDYLVDNMDDFVGKNTNILCDISLAKKIYSKIVQSHPNIDDLTAIKYFENALNNIRCNDVSDERRENRAKRLSLSPKFNKWDGLDICN